MAVSISGLAFVVYLILIMPSSAIVSQLGFIFTLAWPACSKFFEAPGPPQPNLPFGSPAAKANSVPQQLLQRTHHNLHLAGVWAV